MSTLQISNVVQNMERSGVYNFVTIYISDKENMEHACVHHVF
jgi:hypothetical protein